MLNELHVLATVELPHDRIAGDLATAGQDVRLDLVNLSRPHAGTDLRRDPEQVRRPLFSGLDCQDHVAQLNLDATILQREQACRLPHGFPQSDDARIQDLPLGASHRKLPDVDLELAEPLQR